MCAKIGKPCRAAVLLAAWTVLGLGGALAQGGSPTVAATLADAVVEVGEATQYQITVNEGRADLPPPAPKVNGLDINYVTEEKSDGWYYDSRYGGGRTVHTVVYFYSVKATQAGRYVIPGQQVMVGGLALRTLPITLTVDDNGSNGATPPAETVSAELMIPKKTAYVGESIPLEVRAYFGANVRRQPDPDPVLAGEGFSVQKFTPPNGSQQVIDGFHYNVITYKTAIAGLKIGSLSIGPVETNPVIQLPVAAPKRRRPNSLFNGLDGFFGGLNLQPPTRVTVRTEAMGVEILPLPAGKPADFSGGIGQFKLDVEAEPRRVQAGDPVTVRLILSGQGNFDRASPPVLADGHGLKSYPPSAKFKADDEVGLSGVKTFEQVVIADGARNSLPSYRFNYLDPATGKYVSLETPPVAVKIEGTAATPAPVPALAPEANPATTATPTPTPAPRAAEDILYIRADPGTSRDRAAFLPVYQRRSFWLAQGVPLAALLVALAGMGLRARARDEVARRESRRQREQADLQRALRKQDTGRREFYLAAMRLAQLRAASGRPDAPQTAAEISQARRLDPQTATSVQEIFHRHDELAYSGGQFAQEPVPADERRGVLATLETLGKNGQ